MEQPKRILVATDMRDGVQNVLNSAVLMARAFGSEIALLHVIPEVKGSPVQPRTLAEPAERLMEQMKKELVEHVPEIKTRVALGPPLARILEMVEEYQADLVMIGSGYKEPGEKYQLGVTAEQIVRYSPRPVCVVRRGQPFKVDRILCPVDFSQHSRDALDFGVMLALAFGAELSVLHVIEPLSNIFPGRPLINPEEQGSFTEERAAEFDAFLKDVDFRNVQWGKIILQGKPYEEILAFVHERGCRLIIMGSEGRTGLMRFILGSVAEKVIRELPCSMITLKAGS